jgi:pimeloyl-ACP methyl ester carboxylesterase
MAKNMRSPDWQADLDRFRAVCDTQERALDGHVWGYIRRGCGAEAVLILPGGLAVAETAFRYIQRLEARYRVLAPTYPDTIATMAPLVGGLAKLIRAEQIELIHVVGGSYSGLVAQCLVRQRPELVGKLILADTGVPRRSRAAQFALYQPLAAHLPIWALRGLSRCGVALFVRKLPAQRAFWRRYFMQRIAGMPRAAFVSHLAVWRDFDRSYQFAAGDLAGWRGRMLILEAERDGLFPQRERVSLRKLYPSAAVHTFAHRSHGASLAFMDDYIAVIERFLSIEAREIEEKPSAPPLPHDMPHNGR